MERLSDVEFINDNSGKRCLPIESGGILNLKFKYETINLEISIQPHNVTLN